MRHNFLCETCEHAHLTQVIVTTMEPNPLNGGRPVATQHKMIQPWCLAHSVPIILNPTSPIVECERYKGAECEKILTTLDAVEKAKELKDQSETAKTLQ